MDSSTPGGTGWWRWPLPRIPMTLSFCWQGRCFSCALPARRRTCGIFRAEHAALRICRMTRSSACAGARRQGRPRSPEHGCIPRWRTTSPSTTTRPRSRASGSVIREVKPHIILTQPPRGLHGGSREHLPAGGDGGFRALHAQLRRGPAAGGVGWGHCDLSFDATRTARRAAAPAAAGRLCGLRAGDGDEAGDAVAAPSQKEWLERSQGMGSYIAEMEGMCRTLGSMSRRFEFAEGWVRHLHLGFGPAELRSPVRRRSAPRAGRTPSSRRNWTGFTRETEGDMTVWRGR